MAVIRSDSVDRCVEIGRSCFKGGIKILEITFTVPDAPKAISILSEEIKGAYVGAGTVITDEQFNIAVKSGAKYVVSHTCPKSLQYSQGLSRRFTFGDNDAY